MRRALIGQSNGAVAVALGVAVGQALHALGQAGDLVRLRTHDVRQVIDAAGQVGDLFFEGYRHGATMPCGRGGVNLAAPRPLG